MKELKITMLGASGVGKTTLLTSMYEKFESIAQEANLQLIADTETKKTLEDNLQRLKSLGQEFKADERDKKGIVGTAAMAGPDSLPKFIFDLGKKEQKPELRLVFRDYPGGYISSTDIAGRRFVQDLLRDCDVVIIAIDTPPMMEQDGRWHEARNQPNEILELFKAAYQKLKEPKLVIFAPVKCEVYVQPEDQKPGDENDEGKKSKNEESAKKLLECLKEKYAPLLAFLKDPARAEYIAVAVTPIQSVGSMIFSRIEVEYFNKPRFYFRKRTIDAQYTQNGDALLRYLLRFLFKRHNQNLLIERSPILRAFRELLNHDTVFEQAIEKFVKNSKTTGGFAVLHDGKNWLNI